MSHLRIQYIGFYVNLKNIKLLDLSIRCNFLIDLRPQTHHSVCCFVLLVCLVWSGLSELCKKLVPIQHVVGKAEA